MSLYLMKECVLNFVFLVFVSGAVQELFLSLKIYKETKKKEDKQNNTHIQYVIMQIQNVWKCLLIFKRFQYRKCN